MAITRQGHHLGRWIAAGAIFVCSAAPLRAELSVRDLTGGAVQAVGPYYQDVRDAIRAFAAGDPKRALDHLKNAKKVTPALAPPEIMMAALYLDAGQTRQGIAMLETAAKQSPNDPEAYLMLGERALAEGRLTEAELLFPTIEKFVEAFNQNPHRRRDLRVRAYGLGAAIDQSRGNLDGAKAKIQSLLKLDPQNGKAHASLGRVLFAQNDRRGAYEEFQRAAQMDQDTVPAELMMASLYTDKVSAEKWLNHAIATNPDDLRTQIGAANFLLSTNQVDQAKQHAAKAVALDPDGFESNLLAGLVARMNGDFAKAVEHLSTAHLLQPVNFAVMDHLALALLELPDEPSHLRALQFAELAARENPENPAHMATLAWINYRLNRKSEADRFFAAAINSDRVQATQTMSPEMGYYLAHVARDRGQADEAVRLLRDALNTDQPFAYRRQAQQLLAQMTKSSGSSGADAGSTRTGQQAR